MGRKIVAQRRGGRRWSYSYTRITSVTFAALLACAMASPLHADGDEDKAIAWRHGDVGARPSMGERDMLKTAHDVRSAGGRHVVVQFGRPVTAEARAALQRRGIELLTPLGSDAYFAALNDEELRVDAMAVIAPLKRVDAIEPAWKIHELLADGNEPDWAIIRRTEHAQPIVAAYVLLHRDVDGAAARALMQDMGVDVRTVLRTVNGFVIELPLDRVRFVAALDGVQWIEPALPPLGAMNDLARASIGADVLQGPPYSLDGSAVKVMVYDSGTVDGSHPDLAGRVTVHDSVGASQHSTHVSGIIGGTGAESGGLYRGMAPNVHIESYALETFGLGDFVLYDDPGDLEHDYEDAINNVGVDLANNSIGSNVAVLGLPCALEGDYSVVSAIVDSIASGALGRELPIMWAAGNERIFPSLCGTGWRTIPPPATAKNSIVVGAVYSDFDVITSFSSYGPVDDGRIRPDVCAPGCELAGDNGVTSTNLGGGYIPLCGTSMATPAVSGVVALMMEDHRNSAPAGAQPLTPAMIKATLVQTALDLWHEGPDYRNGYGLVQADKAVEHVRSGNCVEGEVAQDEVWETPIVVVPGTTELRATIAWMDPPGTPNVNSALVNDLDLMLVGPDGEFFPWTLNPATPGQDAVQTQADHRNNVEQVSVSNPTPGLWQVQVIGFDVPMGPQRFAVASGATIVRVEIMPEGGAPVQLIAGSTTQIDLQVQALGQALVSETLRVHSRVAGTTAYSSQQLRSFGGTSYAARLPASTCGDTIEFYFSAAGSVTGMQFDPPLGPDEPYHARVVDGVLVMNTDGEAPIDGLSAPNDDGAGANASPLAATVPITGVVHQQRRCQSPHPVGDLDGDFRVDGIDLASLLFYWETDEITADLDGNWLVDGLDLAELLLHWSP